MDFPSISRWLHFNITPIRYINKKISVDDILYAYNKQNDKSISVDDLIVTLKDAGYKSSMIDDKLHFNVSSSSKCFKRGIDE